MCLKTTLHIAYLCVILDILHLMRIYVVTDSNYRHYAQILHNFIVWGINYLNTYCEHYAYYILIVHLADIM